jgi:pectin methylesterase-like acyl-CoA thioesterase
VEHDPNGALPEYWSESAAAPFIAAWRALGLTDAQIVATARGTRDGNPTPPNGPKALDKAMRVAAAPRATQTAVDANLASAIINRKSYMLTHVTRSRAEDLVAKGLVSVEQCKAARVL